MKGRLRSTIEITIIAETMEERLRCIARFICFLVLCKHLYSLSPIHASRPPSIIGFFGQNGIPGDINLAAAPKRSAHSAGEKLNHSLLFRFRFYHLSRNEPVLP